MCAKNTLDVLDFSGIFSFYCSLRLEMFVVYFKSNVDRINNSFNSTLFAHNTNKNTNLRWRTTMANLSFSANIKPNVLSKAMFQRAHFLETANLLNTICDLSRSDSTVRINTKPATIHYYKWERMYTYIKRWQAFR